MSYVIQGLWSDGRIVCEEITDIDRIVAINKAIKLLHDRTFEGDSVRIITDDGELEWDSNDLKTYQVVRKYAQYPDEDLFRGLTLEEARENCNDSESSSSTCTSEEGLMRTVKFGPWFHVYYEE